MRCLELVFDGRHVLNLERLGPEVNASNMAGVKRSAIFAGLLLAPTLAAAQPDGIHRWRPGESGGWEYDYTGGPIPLSGTLEVRQREDLKTAGLITAGIAWGASMCVAWVGDLICNGGCADHSYDLLWVPVVGPAIAAGMPGVTQLPNGPAFSAVFVADSVIQLGGLLVFLIGTVWKQEVVTVSMARGGPPARLSLLIAC